MKKCSITYGKNKISFLLNQDNRKSLKISVSPDMSIQVAAPNNIPEYKIIGKVQKKGGWIIKKLEYFRAFHPLRPPKKYVSGESHRYLGRQYRLKVMPNHKDEVKLDGRYLYLYTRNKDNAKHNKEVLCGWYREKAMNRFQRMFEALYQRLKKYELNEPKLKVKTMKSRWGSCSARKETVTLNTELIKVPSHCIEYVIIHELCHMKHLNHNRSFYDFLALVMPDWIERKKRLEKVVL